MTLAGENGRSPQDTPSVRSSLTLQADHPCKRTTTVSSTLLLKMRLVLNLRAARQDYFKSIPNARFGSVQTLCKRQIIPRLSGPKAFPQLTFPPQRAAHWNRQQPPFMNYL